MVVSDREWYERKPTEALEVWFAQRGVACAPVVPSMIALPNAKPLRCFQNVLDYAERHPTRWQPCWGWSLLPSFHECNKFGLECHAVLQNKKTLALVDVTPDLEFPGRPKLFVRDASVESLVKRGVLSDSVGACTRCCRTFGAAQPS